MLRGKCGTHNVCGRGPLRPMLCRTIVLGMIAAAMCGCRHPLQMIAETRAIVHPSVAEDRGPLADMPVIPADGPSCAKIALIDVDGLLVNAPLTGLSSLGENPVAIFRERLDRIEADHCFRAVVVRINSPGGGVTASDIMWRDLSAMKCRTHLPVVACLVDVATGGGYYVATAADQIVAHPTTITGGMGVILNLYNLQDAMAQFNIVGAPIKAGKHVDLGTPIAAIDDDARRILQQIADQYHDRFREVVRTARPEHDPSKEEDFDGRIFLAEEALNRRLVDSIGYLDDAVALARQMGCAPDAQVVMLHRCNDAVRSPHGTSPNSPIQSSILPVSMPGWERAQMPAFLYMWQPDPTLEHRATGR
jgi:protease IV